MRAMLMRFSNSVVRFSAVLLLPACLRCARAEDWIGRLAEPNSPIPDYKIAANRTYELGRWSEGADSLSMCPGNKEDKLNYLVQPESMSLCD